MTCDFMIVGQGLAGTLLAHFLQKKGKSVIVIDEYNAQSASRVAAGVINPITGRRYVKSWRVDDFLPFAKQTYQQLETQLNLSFYTERNIVRVLQDNKQENEWILRSDYPGVSQYILEDVDASEYKEIVHPVFAWGESQQSAQVNIGNLIDNYRRFLLSRKCVIETKVDYSLLRIEEDKVWYESIEARKIIFCEGYQSAENPYFNHLPYEPAKGEVLIIKIPGFDTTKMAKLNIFLIPLGNELYWAGSSYDWKFKDDQPTEIAKKNLIDKLRKWIKVPFEVVEHKAAIRPVFKNRRPKLGAHPEYPNLFIFNGLGTKGASLGPFWANHLAEHLISGQVIDEEVKI